MRHFSKYDLSTGERVYIERVNKKADFSSEKLKNNQKHKRRLIQDEDEKLRHNHLTGRDILLQELSEEETNSAPVQEKKETKIYRKHVFVPFSNPLSGFFPLLAFFFSLTFLLHGGTENPVAVPRDSNFNNTSAYNNTRVEAQLVVGIKENTRVVHFIRDNNDPRVVTKTYHIKNVDAYEFRDYLRQMVQAKRVGNTMLQQQYPGNQGQGNSTAATVSTPTVTTPVNAQTTYNPPAQLGSNTAVECLKYADGTGLLIVSAEEYRFKDHKNGMGIDSLVAFLDKPQMGAFLGTQTFFYIPKYVPAKNLLPLIQNVGMNISDVTEIWQGADAVTNDPDLNWLLFDVTNYSMPNIEKMLREYDKPIPQVRLTITVYEIYDEDDDKMGLDFQAWKNNEGVDFFSGGGRFRDNWSAVYGSGLMQTGSERTSFYNFNPKWNTRYIDFLASTGKAKVLHTGQLCIRNNTSAVLDRTTGIFYMDTSEQAPDTQISPDLGVNAYKLLSKLVDKVIKDDIPAAKGNIVKTEKSDSFGFSMKINNASVNLKETHFDVLLSNSSLIGFNSNGVPRIAKNNSLSLKISLPNSKNTFVIGGLKKQQIVESTNGIPFLCDIPILGYLFSTKSKSVKTAELVVMGQCSLIPADEMEKADPSSFHLNNTFAKKW